MIANEVKNEFLTYKLIANYESLWFKHNCVSERAMSKGSGETLLLPPRTDGTPETEAKEIRWTSC